MAAINPSIAFGVQLSKNIHFQLYAPTYKELPEKEDEYGIFGIMGNGKGLTLIRSKTKRENPIRQSFSTENESV